MSGRRDVDPSYAGHPERLPPIATVAELAVALRTSESSVWRMIGDGKVRTLRYRSRRLIDRDPTLEALGLARYAGGDGT